MSVASDEAAVRSYLRLVVGAPLQATDAVPPAEQNFVAVAARWAKRTGVDRRTLAGLGVPKTVLDRAGVVQPPIGVLVGGHYSRTPFDVTTLARRACVSERSVRQAVADDERAGVIQRMPSTGRASSWRAAR